MSPWSVLSPYVGSTLILRALGPHFNVNFNFNPEKNVNFNIDFNPEKDVYIYLYFYQEREQLLGEAEECAPRRR